MNMAERIDLLFKTVTKPDDQEYSYREVEELTGGAISSTAIWKLRVGKTQNPRRGTLQALSRAFQVPISFFSDESVSSEDIPGYRERYRSEKLAEQIALRTHELDNEVKQTILDMINYVRRTQDSETKREGRGGSGQGQRQSADAKPIS